MPHETIRPAFTNSCPCLNVTSLLQFPASVRRAHIVTYNPNTQTTAPITRTQSGRGISTQFIGGGSNGYASIHQPNPTGIRCAAADVQL